MGICENAARPVPRRPRHGVRLRAAPRPRPRHRRARSARCATAGRGSSSPWAATSSRPRPTPHVTEAAMRRCRLTVHVSTKLNRSHVVTGERALILPGARPHRRRRARRARAVRHRRGLDGHGARLARQPAALGPTHLLARSRSSAGLARCRARAGRRTCPGRTFAGRLRPASATRIERVVPGFDDYNARVRDPGGFALPQRAARRARVPHGHGQGQLHREPGDLAGVPAGAAAAADPAQPRPVQHHDLRPRRPLPRHPRRPPRRARQPRRRGRARSGRRRRSCDLVSEWSDGDRARPAFPDRPLPDRRAAAPPRTSPRRTCSCRSTRSPRPATPRPRSRSWCASSPTAAGPPGP